jgi:hypothetical protein
VAGNLFPLGPARLAVHRAARRLQQVGIDAAGQWPGGYDNEPGWDFLRYIFQPVDSGQPDDLFNPVTSPAEPI